MQIKTKKYKAFTLVELMILLTLLTILMAAFAPIMTARKYFASKSGGIWTFIQNDSGYDAVAKGKKRFYFGFAPQNKAEADKINGDTNFGNPTIVINQSGKLNSGTQNTMHFRYGKTEGGKHIGDLYTDANRNLLLGGSYNKLRNNYNNETGSSIGLNTSFGINTLNELTNHSNNTAVGYNALKNTDLHNITAVGKGAGEYGAGESDVLIGQDVGIKNSGGSNVIIGTSNTYNGNGKENTIVGSTEYAIRNIGNGNTALGWYAMQDVSGNYNTAIGSCAFNIRKDHGGVGNYNTAIGYLAGTFCTSGGQSISNSSNIGIGNNKTFVTYSQRDCSTIANAASSSLLQSLLSDDTPRVFIGPTPTAHKGLAVLEVHNASGTNSNSKPVPNMGNETVVVNGDLIVRGQTYLNTYYSSNFPSSDYREGPYLTGFWAMPTNEGILQTGWPNYESSNDLLFTGHDGSMNFYDRGADYMSCDGGSTWNTLTGDDAIKHGLAGRACFCATGTVGAIKSYDWTSPSTVSNNKYSTLSSHSTAGSAWVDGSGLGNIPMGNEFINYTHVPGNSSCCPRLSDIKSKNIESEFTSGLKDLEKIDIYNYTYKSDNLPHVGVIAQDLKQIFPNSVFKNKNGYYSIRWDEMFYSAINAVKELYAKINNLIARIEKNQKRISQLKQQNKNLELQLEKISQEIESIENKH